MTRIKATIDGVSYAGHEFLIYGNMFGDKCIAESNGRYIIRWGESNSWKIALAVVKSCDMQQPTHDSYIFKNTGVDDSYDIVRIDHYPSGFCGVFVKEDSLGFFLDVLDTDFILNEMTYAEVIEEEIVARIFDSALFDADIVLRGIKAPRSIYAEMDRPEFDTLGDVFDSLNIQKRADIIRTAMVAADYDPRDYVDGGDIYIDVDRFSEMLIKIVRGIALGKLNR